MKYKYEKNDGIFYKITETSTGTEIKENVSLVEAQKLCKHLNRGGGFSGFTPNFFVNKLT